jgi:ABC-type nitrate/sulfonate/bicarbonate transport system substrate-binding protein
MTRITAVGRRNAVIAIGVMLALCISFVDLALAAPEKIHKIKYAYIPNPDTALLNIGIDKGIFKDLGLEIEMTRFNSGPAQFAAIKSGAIDVAEMSSMTFLIGVSQGIDAKVFSLFADLSLQNILVAQSNSGIKTAKDLKGKKITAVQGSSAYYGLMTYLSKNGLTLKDIEFLNMDGGAITPAFLKKDVDAAWHWAPWCIKMMEAGGVAVTNNKELGALGYQVVLGRSDWMKSNQEAAKLFIEFQARVNKMINDDRNLLIKQIAEVLSLPPETATKVRDVNIFINPSDMISDKSVYWMAGGYSDGSSGLGALLKNTSEFQISQGILKSVPDLKVTIDPGPIKAWIGSRK